MLGAVSGARVDDARAALRELNVGAAEFVREVVGAVTPRTPSGQSSDQWPAAATRELLRDVVAWAATPVGTADASVVLGARLTSEIDAVLAAGPELPMSVGAGLPENSGFCDEAEVVAPEWAPRGTPAADEWHRQARHARSGRALWRLLREGMRGVPLRRLDTAVANAATYGWGCLAMCAGIGMPGNVRRLAGALLAYMLFDHIGDSIADSTERRLVLREMMRFWATGEWSRSPPPPRAVRRALPAPTREACRLSREWVAAERGAHSGAAERDLGEIARAIAHERAAEGDGAALDRTADAVDGALLERSLHKNVAAVAFLLFSFLDRPRDLSPPLLRVAGRAAAFAQLYDDLLDRDDDIRQSQRTAVTALTDAAYRDLTAAAATRVPRLMQDVLATSAAANLISGAFTPARVAMWAETGTLAMHLMVAHRNPAAFAGDPLLSQVCAGSSPFVVLRPLRTWLDPGVATADDPGETPLERMRVRYEQN